MDDMWECVLLICIFVVELLTFLALRNSSSQPLAGDPAPEGAEYTMPVFKTKWKVFVPTTTCKRQTIKPGRLEDTRLTSDRTWVQKHLTNEPPTKYYKVVSEACYTPGWTESDYEKNKCKHTHTWKQGPDWMCVGQSLFDKSS